MNDPTPMRPDPTSGADQDVETLLQLAGRRPRLPEAEVEPARAAAHAAWRRQVGRERARQRLWIGAGLAAALVLAVGVALRGPWGPEPPRQMGTLELSVGEVTVSGLRPASNLASPIGPGARISTGTDGRAALRLSSGPSLRLDSGSQVRLVSAGSVALERGALYVDTGPSSTASAPLEIATPFGSVRHLGTQFEARLISASLSTGQPPPTALRVRVREGAVLVRREGETVAAEAGGEVTLHADGRIARASAPPHGSSWDWIQKAAPPLDIEGTPLADFLAWSSSEIGLPWEYSDPTLRGEAGQIVLHGSIRGLTPEEALSVVLPGCGLRHRRVERALLLEPAVEP